ncbi:LLM class flavin-dependent oxidoreductase [Chitinimonas naiadis]
MIPFSVLDLSPVVQGATPADALRNTLDLAQHAERWGYHRYWLAEHHNMTGIASAATAVVIAHVAAGTQRIRVGSGGIMLPNHSPLVIAEQFGTLESLHPGRIDLGLGRAPGTDMGTARALRRDMMASGDTFPQDVQELQALLGPVRPGQAIQAVPGGGLNVPIWLLGSSLFSAQLAAAMGLPFAFASHFAPDYLMQALQLYRDQFRPSKQLAEPYAMVGLSVVAADTDEEARFLFTSLQQQFTNLRRGTPGKIQAPIKSMADYWQPGENLGVDRALALAAVGSRATVRQQLQDVMARTGADELILTANIYDHAARLRTFEIVADIHAELAAVR